MICYTSQSCLRETIKEQGLQELTRLTGEKFPQEELSYRARIALPFFIEGSLGLMTSILQGKLNPADFPEDHNAINENMPEVLRRYFK
jgi:hypothetical protein